MRVFNRNNDEIKVGSKISKLHEDARFVFTVVDMDELLSTTQHPYSQFVVVTNSQGV